MDGVGLLLDKTINAILLLLVDPVAMHSDSTLGCFSGDLAILETLFDTVLLVHREGRLHLVHHSFVLSHNF
jgi:hypothetical protein